MPFVSDNILKIFEIRKWFMVCRQVLARYPKLSNLADSNLANAVSILWANEIGHVVSKKILSCFGAVWWSAVLHEDEIIVWIQSPAFWQQGRLKKVNVGFLVDFSLLRVDKKLCFSIPRHTCTNHQHLRKPISVVIKCLQTLFYDVQYYFACITANMEVF